MDLILNSKKLVALNLVIIAVINLVLFAFGAISQLLFWIVVIVIAFIAYKIMPKLKGVCNLSYAIVDGHFDDVKKLV